MRPTQPEAEERPLPARLPRLPRAGAGAEPPGRSVPIGIEPAPGDGEQLCVAGDPVRPGRSPGGRGRAAVRRPAKERAVSAPTATELAPALLEEPIPPPKGGVVTALEERTATPEGSAASNGAYAWRVEIQGREQPLLVVADDIGGALRRAAQHLDLPAVSEARAWRVGEVLRERED